MTDLTDNLIPDHHGRVGTHLRTSPLALDRARRLVACYIPAAADLLSELRLTRRGIDARTAQPPTED
jgi:hypothetical protein